MQRSDDSEQSIPVHVVTGFLGSGKSSLIRHLVAHKPADERWAIVINEFGQVGIDQTLFESRDDVVVKGLPGGCLCCQLAFVLQAALVNLIRRERPDRLIIEPSGWGIPPGCWICCAARPSRGCWKCARSLPCSIRVAWMTGVPASTTPFAISC